MITGLCTKKTPGPFEHLETAGNAGFAELIIPVRAPIIGKSLRDIALRKTYGVEPIMLLSGEGEARQNFSDGTTSGRKCAYRSRKMAANQSDGRQQQLRAHYPVDAKEEAEEARPGMALVCFIGAIILTLLGLPIALGLLTGALAMILLRVVPIDEAYRSVNWRTVFLLAGLIPLGIAMDQSGAARYVASHALHLLEGSSSILILCTVGLLTTFFTLVISNVAATVLLVPLAMVMADLSDINPRGMALLVALCASNSFLLPTHQVNALILAPGGYKTADFMRTGSILTILFLGISVLFIYLFHV